MQQPTFPSPRADLVAPRPSGGRGAVPNPSTTYVHSRMVHISKYLQAVRFVLSKTTQESGRPGFCYTTALSSPCSTNYLACRPLVVLQHCKSVRQTHSSTFTAAIQTQPQAEKHSSFCTEAADKTRQANTNQRSIQNSYKDKTVWVIHDRKTAVSLYFLVHSSRRDSPTKATGQR